MCSWIITVLQKNHEREHFNCGQSVLDAYLRQLATQHAKSKISRTFVAVAKDNQKQVLGYYTLSAGSITFDDLSPQLQKKLPRYPVPIVRLGRLAVDEVAQGQGLGEHLLMDALYRSAALTEEIGVVGVVVDAKNAQAKTFYQKYGFSELTNAPMTLFISIQHVLASLQN